MVHPENQKDARVAVELFIMRLLIDVEGAVTDLDEVEIEPDDTTEV